MNVNIPPPPHLYATPIFNVTTSSDDAMQWTLTSLHSPHLYATPIFNVTTSSDDAMQWTLTSPPPPPICMQERQNMHIYIYRRKTEGSYAFRGTPSLSPLYRYVYIYTHVIYIYIYTHVIYIYIYMHIGLSDCHFNGKMLIKDIFFWYRKLRHTHRINRQ